MLADIDLNSRSLVLTNLFVKHILSQSCVLVQDFLKWSKRRSDNVVPMKRIQRLKNPSAWKHCGISGWRIKSITNIKSLCDVQAGILGGYKIHFLILYGYFHLGTGIL